MTVLDNILTSQWTQLWHRRLELRPLLCSHKKIFRLSRIHGHIQGSALDKADVDIQKKAALAEQAAALRVKMRESHLATFRSEAKNRYPFPHPKAASSTACARRG